jgi:hypothetical protein
VKHEKSGDPIYLPLSPPLVTFLVSGEDGEDLPGDLDLIEPDDVVLTMVSKSQAEAEAVEPPCPSCGAQSAAPGYHGHGMHCQRFYSWREAAALA